MPAKQKFLVGDKVQDTITGERHGSAVPVRQHPQAATEASMTGARQPVPE